MLDGPKWLLGRQGQSPWTRQRGPKDGEDGSAEKAGKVSATGKRTQGRNARVRSFKRRDPVCTGMELEMSGHELLPSSVFSLHEYGLSLCPWDAASPPRQVTTWNARPGCGGAQELSP